MQPLKVYLDSNDYSVLSDPSRQNEKLTSVRERLRNWVDSGEIICCFSGVLLSEMSPIEAKFTNAAQRRADLLVELCGKNCLVSPDVLIRREFSNAYELNNVSSESLSNTGEWYPAGATEISPVTNIQFVKIIHETIENAGLNREQRRLARKRSLKKGEPKKSLLKEMAANSKHSSVDEILKIYPMKPDAAKVLRRFSIGAATKEEATAAFQESLRDPRWMMQWFGQHHDELSSFIQWIRKPSEKMLECLLSIYQAAKNMHQLDKELGTAHSDTLLSSAKWDLWQDQVVQNITARISAAFFDMAQKQLSPEDVDKYCPGLSVGIRAMHSAVRSATFATPRKPKPSDFPDALHAIYSPYVDIFRADSFMAPHIKKHAEKYGTVVVSDLTKIPALIEDSLSARNTIQTNFHS